jgi:hypothetical protein
MLSQSTPLVRVSLRQRDIERDHPEYRKEENSMSKVDTIMSWGKVLRSEKSASELRETAKKILAPDTDPVERQALIAGVAAMARVVKMSPDYIVGEINAELSRREHDAAVKAKIVADAESDAEMNQLLKQNPIAKNF